MGWAMIPRRIHYVWVGGPVPQEQQEFIKTWEQTNPDYEIIRWDESNIDFTIPAIKDAYERRQWAKVADFVRLMVVAKHGGIYLDTDFRLYKPLDPLLQYACFFGFQHEEHPTDLISNGVFGAVPDHWFVQKALSRNLSISQPRFRLLERPTAYGPKLITALLREEGLTTYSPHGVMVGDVYLCPVKTFFPFDMNETFTPACLTPQTIGAHFWAESWVKDLPMPIRVLRNAKRTVRRLQGRT
jgi:mannosyltransferase OCH1-like enzyme